MDLNYGTDFSAVVLEGVQQQLEYLKQEQGVAPAVTLLQRQADDFSGFPEEQIDTMLINSVLQYFPNMDYLLRVLEGAVRLVAPGGKIIVSEQEKARQTQEKLAKSQVEGKSIRATKSKGFAIQQRTEGK